MNGADPSAPGPPYRPRPGTIPTLPIPDSRDWRKLHLVGVGGAGMSGLARLLLARAIAVTGSDLKWSQGMATLARLGAMVSVGHRADEPRCQRRPALHRQDLQFLVELTASGRIPALSQDD